MESVAEIQSMKVSELREFLKRNGVAFHQVSRTDGTEGYPRKVDLLATALSIRAEFENPPPPLPESPHEPRNIFQSGYSPTVQKKGSPGRTPKNRGSAAGSTPSRKSRKEDQDIENSVVKKQQERSKQDAEIENSVVKKQKHRRRSSLGWVDPAFLSTLSSNGANLDRSKLVDSTKLKSNEKETQIEISQSEKEDEVQIVSVRDGKYLSGDNADQIIQSDYDSHGGASSGTDSDAGSTFDTDDEQTSTSFKRMKTYEVRAWLNEHNIPFNLRAKKAELVSLATAHALYFENKNDSPIVVTRTGPKAAAAKDQEEISPTKPTARQKTRVSSKSSKSRPVEPEVIEVHSTRSDTQTRRRSRSRVISAPLPDDDNDEGADGDREEDEIQPVRTAQRIQKKHRGREERIVKKPLFNFKIPRITLPPINARKALTFISLFTLAAIIVFYLLNMWSASKRPFCNTNSTIHFTADGKECRPCPSNGICVDGVLKCEKGYLRRGSRCVEDEEVSLYANQLESDIVKILANLKGKAECGMKAPTNLTESQVREAIESAEHQRRSRRRRKYDVSKFDAAFQRAMESLRLREEGPVEFDSAFGVYYSTVGKRPMSCRVQMFLWRHIQKVIVFLLVVIFIGRLWWRRYRTRLYNERVERVYEAALDILREVRLNYEEDDKGDAFMVDTQLREEILGRETTESVKLWVAAEALLRKDSRVLRTGPRTVRGMFCYIYEWRGHLSRGSFGSASRDGFRAFSGSDTESKRRLSFGSAQRQRSPGSNAASPGQGNAPNQETQSPARGMFNLLTRRW